MQSQSWQKDFWFRKAEFFIIKYVAFVYSLAVYMTPAFDLLLYSLNAKHAKYMPKEFGQVTPAWMRYTSAMAWTCLMVFVWHSHVLRVESKALAWVSLIKHFPSGIERTIVPGFYKALKINFGWINKISFYVRNWKRILCSSSFSCFIPVVANLRRRGGEKQGTWLPVYSQIKYVSLCFLTAATSLENVF